MPAACEVPLTGHRRIMLASKSDELSERCSFNPQEVVLAVTRVRLISSLPILLLAVASVLRAQPGVPTTQVSTTLSASRQFETRAQLEAQAREAELQRRTSEAWLLRSRLEKGDFQEGDRIIVVLDGATVVSDTFQVRSGRVLQFPRMGEVSLAGVLRSELTDTVRSHLGKYLTTPVVRAIPLLPIAILGNVVQPGFYYAPADVVLRDVIMRAGGPLAAADLNKVVVRRGGEVIWKPEDVRVALTDGLSLDGLHLRAGDEVFVPEQKRRMQLTTITTIISMAVAVTLAVTQLSR